ncbi:putative F-box/FBD/LRR-repeat protein [Sesbania bispinosa]|nr:putative F-box/FBD/LRR-repeat protein [Sesbania bispinosa]
MEARWGYDLANLRILRLEVRDFLSKLKRVEIQAPSLQKLVFPSIGELAPNLTSFNFCNYLTIDTLNSDDMGDPFKHKPRRKSSIIKNDTEGQKMVIYPKNKRYDVVVLEDWSAMAELSFMTKIIEEAKRTTITTMSFHDLADYIFGDKSKSDMVKILAISSTDESKLYEVLKEKSYISSREQYFATVTDKIEVEASCPAQVLCSPFATPINLSMRQSDHCTYESNFVAH